jgi:hypothetical protein
MNEFPIEASVLTFGVGAVVTFGLFRWIRGTRKVRVPRTPLETKQVGDWIHNRYDNKAHDDSAFGPCLYCHSEDLTGHHVGHFNAFPAYSKDAPGKLWRLIESQDFASAKAISVEGATDIWDYCFEVVLCPNGGHYLVQSEFSRSGKSTIVKRSIVPNEIGNFISHWRELYSIWVISPAPKPPRGSHE